MEKQIKQLSKYNDYELQEYFYTETFSVLHNIKLILDDKYTNTGNSDFTDLQYDMLKDTMVKRDSSYIPEIGSIVRVGENRVTLPYYMGSLSKIKPENINEIENWKTRCFCKEYIVEDKLDGVSALLVIKNGKIKMYTRGDGVIGGDISFLVSYFKTIPKNIKCDIVVRGELIIRKIVFEEKYSSKYANPRNMVAGILGGKKIRKGLTDIDFVAYEIVDLDINLDPYSQIQYLQNVGFTTVNYNIVNDINIENLSHLLIYLKEHSNYEIDGIVVQPNVYNERNISGNCSYAFAFKMRMQENSAVVEVLDVEWSISKWGVLKPRISISPVSLGGVTISYSSGFNGKYIYNNNIGPGAVIKITRSGDVIPYITDVISQAQKPAMPDISYLWNQTGVDIYTEEHSDIPEVKRIASFFSSLGIKHVSEATVNKMYSHGFVSLIDILSASQEELSRISGFGDRLAERTYNNIHKGLQNVQLTSVLGASGVFGFGFGIRKINALFSSIPDILVIYKNYTTEEMFEKVMGVGGYSNKSARKIVDNLESADTFIKTLNPFVTFKSSEVSSSKIFEEMKFVMSGFRDVELERKIVSRGGKIAMSVSKNTYLVIVKVREEKVSVKVKKALDLGKEVVTKDEFEERFLA